MRRTLLALALTSIAGVSYAQTMQSAPAVDAQGRPIAGRTMTMGTGMGSGMNTTGNPNLATAPTTYDANNPPPKYEKTTNNNKLERGHATGLEPMPADKGPRQTAFKDEYGFRYDSDGNRLNARGFVISPHTPSR